MAENWLVRAWRRRDPQVLRPGCLCPTSSFLFPACSSSACPAFSILRLAMLPILGISLKLALQDPAKMLSEHKPPATGVAVGVWVTSRWRRTAFGRFLSGILERWVPDKEAVGDGRRVSREVREDVFSRSWGGDEVEMLTPRSIFPTTSFLAKLAS